LNSVLEKAIDMVDYYCGRTKRAEPHSRTLWIQIQDKNTPFDQAVGALSFGPKVAIEFVFPRPDLHSSRESINTEAKYYTAVCKY
jgi:hypothetical protein